MMRKLQVLTGLMSVSVALAACNAGPLLQTGSLSAAPQKVAAAPATSIDRALHVGATSARAKKCGFYFDAATLKTNFIAAETALGTTAGDLAKVSQAYDYTATSVGAKITDSETYCTAERTQVIKTSLQSALAGNFEPPVKTAAKEEGVFAGLLQNDSVEQEAFNPDHIYDPLLNEKATKPVEQ